MTNRDENFTMGDIIIEDLQTGIINKQVLLITMR